MVEIPHWVVEAIAFIGSLAGAVIALRAKTAILDALTRKLHKRLDKLDTEIDLRFGEINERLHALDKALALAEEREFIREGTPVRDVPSALNPNPRSRTGRRTGAIPVQIEPEKSQDDD